MRVLLFTVAIAVVLAAGFGVRVIWLAILRERADERLAEVRREMEL